MANRKMLFFWKYMHGAPLFEHVVGLAFPLATTMIFTLVVNEALKKLSVTIPTLANAVNPLTILFSVILFFIILWLQQLILSTLFRKSLTEYLYRTKGRHPVTKIFGAEILNRFLSDSFKPEMVEGIESLSTMLEKIEQPNGQPLAPVSYAILLDKAAAMEPDKLLAVWDFGAVPIEKVFLDTGQPNGEYGFYFNTLKKIYSNIANQKNKRRVFLFNDDNHRKVVQKHSGWNGLMEMLDEWGIDVYYYGNIDILNGIKSSVPFAMDDFVWFTVSGWIKQSWVIGFERETRITSLRHRQYFIQDVEKVFEQLIKSCAQMNVEQ